MRLCAALTSELNHTSNKSALVEGEKCPGGLRAAGQRSASFLLTEQGDSDSSSIRVWDGKQQESKEGQPGCFPVLLLAAGGALLGCWGLPGLPLGLVGPC